MHWREMFEEELEAWMRDSAAWPHRRSPDVFLEWFDVEVADLVTDLNDQPI